MARGAQGGQLLAYLSRLPQDRRRFIPPLHALFCRWGGATWGYMENLPERPRIWTGWLQKGCFSQTSTQPTRCAHHVSWGWPVGTRSRDQDSGSTHLPSKQSTGRAGRRVRPSPFPIGAPAHWGTQTPCCRRPPVASAFLLSWSGVAVCGSEQAPPPPRTTACAGETPYELPQGGEGRPVLGGRVEAVVPGALPTRLSLWRRQQE